MAHDPRTTAQDVLVPDQLQNMSLPVILAVLARFYDQLAKDQATSAAAKHVEHAIDILMATLAKSRERDLH